MNRISKEIVESPYKIRDIGIQVMVEPPTADDPTSMPQGMQADIQRILETIIRTSIDKEAAGELTMEELNDKIAVSVQPFNGKVDEFCSKIRNPMVGLRGWWCTSSHFAVLVFIYSEIDVKRKS